MKKRSKITVLTEETALAFFARHLDELKWKYYRGADRRILIGCFGGDHVQWVFNMTVHESAPGLFQLGVNSFIPNLVVPPQRADILELLARINFELSLGCFKLNLGNGEISFRTSVILPGADITPGIVEHLVRSNLCLVNERYAQVMAVLYGSVTPEEALKRKAEVKPEPRSELN